MLRAARGKICSVVLEKGKCRGGGVVGLRGKVYLESAAQVGGRPMVAPTCAVRMGGVPDAPGTAARLRAHMECAPTVWRANDVRPYMGLKMRFFDRLLPYYIYI